MSFRQVSCRLPGSKYLSSPEVLWGLRAAGGNHCTKGPRMSTFCVCFPIFHLSSFQSVRLLSDRNDETKAAFFTTLNSVHAQIFNLRRELKSNRWTVHWFSFRISWTQYLVWFGLPMRRCLTMPGYSWCYEIARLVGQDVHAWIPDSQRFYVWTDMMLIDF